MTSTSEAVNAYLDLLSASIDTKTIKQPDFKYIIHQIGREDHEAAKRRCLQRMEEKGEDVLTWALYGLILMLQAEVKEAGDALLKAGRLDPENLLVINLMGDYLCFAGREMEGEDVYRVSLSRDEKQVHPRQMMFFQFMFRNEYLQALEVITPALQSRPEDERIWTSIKTALAMMGSHDYAKEVAESLTQEFSNLHTAWRFKAHVYLVTRDYSKAEEAAKQAIRLKQDDGDNWNQLGTILSMSGRTAAAIKCQRKAIKLAPKNGMFWTSLGLALLKAGERDECKRVITKAVKLDPEAALELVQHMSMTS